jgi:dolichol kinase
MVGVCKICHNALICFLIIITSLQTKFAALTQLAAGKFSQVTDNMEKSLTLFMRRQETCDTSKGSTMFHMMMMMMMITLTTPEALQMQGRFSNEVCVCMVGSIQYIHYIEPTTHINAHTPE